MDGIRALWHIDFGDIKYAYYFIFLASIMVIECHYLRQNWWKSLIGENLNANFQNYMDLKLSIEMVY